MGQTAHRRQVMEATSWRSLLQWGCPCRGYRYHRPLPLQVNRGNRCRRCAASRHRQKRKNHTGGGRLDPSTDRKRAKRGAGTKGSVGPTLGLRSKRDSQLAAPIRPGGKRTLPVMSEVHRNKRLRHTIVGSFWINHRKRKALESTTSAKRLLNQPPEAKRLLNQPPETNGSVTPSSEALQIYYYMPLLHVCTTNPALLAAKKWSLFCVAEMRFLRSCSATEPPSSHNTRGVSSQ